MAGFQVKRLGAKVGAGKVAQETGSENGEVGYMRLGSRGLGSSSRQSADRGQIFFSCRGKANLGGKDFPFDKRIATYIFKKSSAEAGRRRPAG